MAESGGLFILDGEDAGSTPWEFDSVTNEGSNVFSLQAGAKNNGTYGYSIVFDGINNDCYALKAFASAKNEVYVRAYVYIDSTLVIPAWGVLGLFSIRDGTTILCKAWVRNNTGSAAVPNTWRVGGQDLTTVLSATNYSTDTWHYIELHWKKGSGADGGAQVWVDGDSILNEFDNNLTAYAADDIMIGTQFDALPAANGDFLYFDDIKADTSYIGAYSDSGLSWTAKQDMLIGF